MKIAAAQTAIGYEAQPDNLQKAAAWTHQAAANGADIILFPEMSFTGFTMHVPAAAEMGKTAFVKMQRLAADCSIAAGFGWVGINADGMGENHYTILQKDGSVLLDYIKIHPFSYGGEDQHYQSGSKIVSGVLCGIPVSVLICYDLRFPEVFRLASRQASLLIVPANWMSRRQAHFELLLRARAIENQVYVLGINCVGAQNAYHFAGGSCLIDPEGNTRMQCGDKEALVLAEIEDDTAVFRQAFPTCRDVQMAQYAAWYENLST